MPVEQAALTFCARKQKTLSSSGCVTLLHVIIFVINVSGAAIASLGRHAHKLPFTTTLQGPSADAPEEAEDIEVDLELQQALIQSIRPTPAKGQGKRSALQDMSNWRLPTPAKKQGLAKGHSSTPLQALNGIAGQLFPVTQDLHPSDCVRQILHFEV